MDKQPEKNRKRSPINGQPVPSGRPKGCPNKFTTLKQSFLNVYERLGGDDALFVWAKQHKAMFYQMITKLFPQDVNQAVSGSLDVNVHTIITKDNPNE